MSTRHARMLSFAILACIMAAADVVVAAKNIGACGVIAEPGSYLLSKNLTAVGDCLTVTADFVTIDLGGFTIFGDGTGAAIKGDGTRRAITMRDGTITNFDDGIDFCPVTGPGTTGHQLVVERIRAIDNADAGICTWWRGLP